MSQAADGRRSSPPATRARPPGRGDWGMPVCRQEACPLTASAAPATAGAAAQRRQPRGSAARALTASSAVQQGQHGAPQQCSSRRQARSEARPRSTAGGQREGGEYVWATRGWWVCGSGVAVGTPGLPVCGLQGWEGEIGGMCHRGVKSSGLPQGMCHRGTAGGNHWLWEPARPSPVAAGCCLARVAIWCLSCLLAAAAAAAADDTDAAADDDGRPVRRCT